MAEFVYSVILLLIGVGVVLQHMSLVLYCLQLSGYTIKSLWRGWLDGVSRSWVYWLLYFIIAICFLILKVESLFILTIFAIISFVIIFTVSDKCACYKKIVYTKRMIRILILFSILVILSLVTLLKFVSTNYLGICFPLIVFLDYIVLSVALIFLYPIEKIIGAYFISKAKNKISLNKKLIKIGITGSFGKTSTKEILTTILQESFNTLATPKSYNTPFGITKTINENLTNSHEIFVCEMGAKAKGEIKYLCDLIGVHYGVVTSVGRQHTNTFGGIEGVYRAKKELPDYLFNRTCVFNLMNDYTRRMYKEFLGTSIGVYLVVKHNLTIIRVLVKKKLGSLLIRCGTITKLKLFEFPKYKNYYAKKIVCNENGSGFDVWHGSEFLFHANCVLIGYHNVLNVMLSIAIAKTLNMPNRAIVKGINKIVPIKARLEKFITKNGAIIINNGYNSNIDSAKFTFETLSLFNKRNKVIITPGLIDTEDDFTYNRKFGELMSKYCDEVIIVKQKNKDAITLGLSNMCFDMAKVFYVNNFKDLKAYLDNLNSDYVVLIENDLPDNYR